MIVGRIKKNERARQFCSPHGGCGDSAVREEVKKKREGGKRKREIQRPLVPFFFSFLLQFSPCHTPNAIKVAAKSHQVTTTTGARNAGIFALIRVGNLCCSRQRLPPKEDSSLLIQLP